MFYLILIKKEAKRDHFLSFDEDTEGIESRL